MTYLCVAIFVRDEAQARRDMAMAAEEGADLVELRVDEVSDRDLVGRLIAASGVPCIITCRPVWEGGRCTLPEEERLLAISDFAESKPAYIDLEFAVSDDVKSALSSMSAQTARHDRPGVIFSSHNFQGRPARLTTLFEKLSQSSADIAKIVWTARTVRDNLEAFELLRQRSKPTIALCMGEAGLISRILAKKFGAFLTFASIDSAGGTAPGQISVREMKRLYRWDAINAHTRVFGVVGSPIAHSMSPAIHNAAFDETGFDGIYVPFLVEPSYESFKAFMETFLAAEGLDLSGLSITIPHKENALRYLKEKGSAIDLLAERIGAVNTIVINRSMQQATLSGTSTDYAAILDSITTQLQITREALHDYRVAVIGAGGTGRTAVAALAHYGATVVVYNRTREKADALAAEFDGKSGKVVAADMAKLCDSCCHIYFNATSIGMNPKTEESPFGDRVPALTANSVVFDAVYNPIRTKLLKQAEAAGAKTITGVEMFIRQAAGQFQAWTGMPAPVEVMRRVVLDRL